MASLNSLKPKTKPWGLRWRCSYWFVTFVVGLGIMTDLMVYSLIIPVIPFQLQKMGNSGVSGLVGWLLFAYSAGLVVSTPPIASLSERYKNRQIPLLLGLGALIGSQVILMEAPKYWVMVLARVIQGIGSSFVWVVGLALLCDSTPEDLMGRQLGIAITGMSLGVLVGPPAAGALYDRWGFRAPFVFAMIIISIDLLGRLLVIERKDAVPWGVDPAACSNATAPVEEGRPELTNEVESALPSATSHNKDGISSEERTSQRPPSYRPVHLTPLGVLMKLLRSSRAMTCILSTLVYGIVYSGQEAVLPLHLQAVWGFSSAQAGLAYIAAVVPTFLALPLTGWWADNKGPEWASTTCLFLSLPWWVGVTVNGSLAQFLVFLGLQSLFTSGNVSPLTSELASVCRSIEGIGYAHVYGAFNLAFGIGSAVGPIISGQIYDHTTHGWKIFCLLSMSILAFSGILTFIFTGEKPLVTRLLAKIRRERGIGLR